MLFLIPPAIASLAPLWQETTPRNDAVFELVAPLLKKAKERVKTVPDTEYRALSWLKIANIERVMGKPEAAKAALDSALKEMRSNPSHEGYKESFLITIASRYSTFGYKEMAHQVFTEAAAIGAKVKKPEKRFEILYNVADTQFTFGDTVGGKATLAQVIEGLTPELRKSARVKAYLLNTQAKMQGRANNISNAKRTAAKMADTSDRFYYYLWLAQWQAKHGNRAEAKVTRNEALVLALKEKDTETRLANLSSLLREMGKQGEGEAAKKQAGDTPELLRAIAEGQLANDDLQGARKAYNKPFNVMVVALARAGEVKTAQEMFSTMMSKEKVFSSDEIQMRGEIAAGLARKGDSAGAKAIIAEAEKKASEN